jgi:Tfp pilus assembly protein PilO
MDLGTPMGTKIAGAVALVVVAGLGWTFVVGPETGALAESRDEVISIRDQNTLLASQLAALERQREGLAETRRTARELAEKFPPTADQPGLFEEVTGAAEDAGIGAQNVTNLAPTPPVIGGATTASGGTTPTDTTSGTAPDAVSGAALARQSVTVDVTGTFDQTELLLENLEHMPRAYLITTVSLAGDAETGAFTTTITGDMFVMPPVQDPGKTLNLSSTTQPEG